RPRRAPPPPPRPAPPAGAAGPPPGGATARLRVGPDPSGDRRAVLVESGVDAVLVVHLAPGDGRVEGADHPHLVLRAHRVLVVLVEQVHRAVPQLVDLARLLVRDGAGTADAVHGLDVVLVVERRGGAGEEGGLVEREADALACEHHTTAAPVVADDVALGAVEVVDVHNVHGWLLKMVGTRRSGERAHVLGSMP